MSVRILNADCLIALPQLAAESVHAIVTDPPAGISFMGKDWDGDKGGRDHWIAWMQEVAAECLRVCKPGGHALVWALPRTSHWTATAWENAGWQVRDRCAHLFGSGFPKSLDVSKAIDRAAGAEREVIGPRVRLGDDKPYAHNPSSNIYGEDNGANGGWRPPDTRPATPEAAAWSGWGTALKPACEDWWLLRKPLEKGLSVAANTLRHGCGGLNIDSSRIPMSAADADNINGKHAGMDPDSYERPAGVSLNLSVRPMSLQQAQAHALGRWPANVLHDGSPEVEEAFARFGDLTSGSRDGKRKAHSEFGTFCERERDSGYARTGDTGSASRFFKSCPYEEHEWNAHASGAEDSTSLQSDRAVSALVHAVEASTPRSVLIRASYQAQDTSVTASELRQIVASVTGLIRNIEVASSLGLPRERHSLSLSHVRCAAIPGPTDTTMITVSRSSSGGYADLATFSITQGSKEPGATASLSGTRFHFCGKADATDRVGSLHPTVKPQSLMSWLVQLVTPPNGTVLDPFAGTGSTGLAADRLGMNAVLIEQDPTYAADARRKIASDAPLFTEVA